MTKKKFWTLYLLLVALMLPALAESFESSIAALKQHRQKLAHVVDNIPKLREDCNRLEQRVTELIRSKGDEARALAEGFEAPGRSDQHNPPSIPEIDDSSFTPEQRKEAELLRRELLQIEAWIPMASELEDRKAGLELLVKKLESLPSTGAPGKT